MQLKRLKLRRNNWDSDTYEFDDVLTEFASQKRVYEVVARPVVEVCIYGPGGLSFHSLYNQISSLKMCRGVGVHENWLWDP